MSVATLSPAARTLPNGLRVITVEVPHLHTVSLVMYVKIGSRYETAETNGLSHFVEHMLFRGTEQHPDSHSLHLAIEDFGGTLYAETGRDYSLYQIAVHPESLDSALAMLGELFTHPTFPDLELERAIIREEILEDLDEEGHLISITDVARAAAWGSHPLGFKITGPLGNVDHFEVGAVREHFARYYGASNMILCLAGSVRDAEAWPRVCEHFSGIPDGPAATPLPAPDDQRHPHLAHVEHPGSQTSVQILFRGLPEQDPGFIALAALGRVLDDGMSTRLHYRVCDQLGLAYYCAASLEPLHDTALFEVDAVSAHDKLPDLVRESLALLARFREAPPSAAELQKAQRRYRWDLEATYDDPDALAGYFGGTRLFYAPEPLAQKARRMQAVTPDDVMATAQRLFQPERLTVATVGALPAARRREVEQIVTRFS